MLLDLKYYFWVICKYISCYDMAKIVKLLFIFLLFFKFNQVINKCTKENNLKKIHGAL